MKENFYTEQEGKRKAVDREGNTNAKTTCTVLERSGLQSPREMDALTTPQSDANQASFGMRFPIFPSKLLFGNTTSEPDPLLILIQVIPIWTQKSNKTSAPTCHRASS